MFGFIRRKIIFKKFVKHWRFINSHNLTYPAKIYPSDDLIKIGNFTYGTIDADYFGSENENLIIGNFVSISKGVKFILGGQHNYNTISTYPFRNKLINNLIEAKSKGIIQVKDDVWIGTNAIILSGVTINQGAIIGAGAIISNDIPAYSIVIGNPAKIIKYRFSEEIIQELMKIDYSKLTKGKITQLDRLLYTNITNSNCSNIINQIIDLIE